MGKKAEFRSLYAKARAAGLEAGKKAVPVPMVVVECDGLGAPAPDAKRWYVSEGACGFSWVRIRPGGSSFARWLKANGLASKSYNGGVDIWISEFNQSIARKEAMAGTMADVFQAAGINAYAGSRLD